jgi:hypothetical protein
MFATIGYFVSKLNCSTQIICNRNQANEDTLAERISWTCLPSEFVRSFMPSETLATSVSVCISRGKKGDSVGNLAEPREI